MLFLFQKSINSSFITNENLTKNGSVYYYLFTERSYSLFQSCLVVVLHNETKGFPLKSILFLKILLTIPKKKSLI